MIFGRKVDMSQSRWHTWFAWLPVRLLDGRIAWLHVVERRFWGQCPSRGYPNYRELGSAMLGFFEYPDSPQ